LHKLVVGDGTDQCRFHSANRVIHGLQE
jgi:hypothetical protein